MTYGDVRRDYPRTSALTRGTPCQFDNLNGNLNATAR